MEFDEITKLTDKQIVDEYKRRVKAKNNGRCTFCGKERKAGPDNFGTRCQCEFGDRIGMFRSSYKFDYFGF